MTKYRQQLANRYLVELSSMISSTARIHLVWLTVILMTWGLGLEPKFEQINENEKEIQAVLKAKGEAHGIINSALKEVRLTIVRQSEEKVIKDREKAKVLFTFPGFEIPVDVTYAGIILELLVFGLITYTFFQRNRFLYKASCLTRLLINELGVAEKDLQNLIHELPWWALPLPNKSRDTHVSVEILKSSLGYVDNPLIKYLTIILFILGMLLLEVRIAQINWFINGDLDDAEASFELIIRIISIGLIVLSVIIAIFWTRKSFVPVYYRGDTNPNAISKRDFFIYGTAFFACTSAYPLVVTTMPFINRNPRFRKKRVYLFNTNLSEGWHLNKRSNVMHYVQGNGQLEYTGRYVRSNLDTADKGLNISNQINSTTYLHIVNFSFAIENEALINIQHDQIDEACELLAFGIEQLSYHGGHDTIRLCDLLAGLSVRYRKEIYMKLLLELAREYPESSEFVSRYIKWGQHNRWTQKWYDKENGLKWAGVVM